MTVCRRTRTFIAQQASEADWAKSDYLIMFRSDDSTDLYRTLEQLAVIEPNPSSLPRLPSGDEVFLPVWESKLMHQFDHRFATFAGLPPADRKQGKTHEVRHDEKEPAWIAIPRYWARIQNVEKPFRDRQWKCQWSAGYRDITNATNERTAIAAILPEGGASQPLNLFLPESAFHGCVWVGCMNSFIVDYIARQRIGGVHLNITTCRQLPIITPALLNSEHRQFISDRVLELTFNSLALEPFARDCGYAGPPFRWDEERRFLLRAELDAAFFHLYLRADEHGNCSPRPLRPVTPRAPKTSPASKSASPTPRRRQLHHGHLSHRPPQRRRKIQRRLPHQTSHPRNLRRHANRHPHRHPLPNPPRPATC